MENSDPDLDVTLKWIKGLANGDVGQELETLTTKGIQVVQAQKGFLLCDFTIHSGLLDKELILTPRSYSSKLIMSSFYLPELLIPSSGKKKLLIEDENGNWHVGAIATLVDLIGSFASFSFASCLQVTLDFSISYYATAKVQEEVKVEAKIIGKKDDLTSVIVEVRKKENGELVALGKLWTAVFKRNLRQQASKL